MSFVLRMAWRETRAAWLRLLFFFVCVAIGVAAIVIIRSVVQNIRYALTSEARQIVGADIMLQSPRPWTKEVLAILDEELAGVHTTRVEAIETRTMAAPADGKGSGKVRLVEMRGVQTGFPIYGQIELQDGGQDAVARLANFGTLVPPEFLIEMGLAV